MALYQTQPDRKLRAKALAKEYGIGGHSYDFLDGSWGFVNHDWKGLEFDHYPDHQKITLKWAQVEKYIDLMIQSDRYLTDEEKEQRTTVQEENGYKVGDDVMVDLPTGTIEGTIGYIGETDVRIDTSAHGQSWDNEVINKRQFEDGLRQNEPSQRVDEMLEQAETIYKESEVPEYERFFVREVVGGTSQLFAIWDDLNEGYYANDNGMAQFTDKEQAESYCTALKKETDERTAADWLAVEKAKFLAENEPVPALPKERDYRVGDTIRLDGKDFTVETVGTLNIQLRDPDEVYPVARSESKENLERLLRQPGNIHLHNLTVNLTPAHEPDEDKPPLTDEELDELPISNVMDGKVQTFPDAVALDEALNAEPAPEPAGNFHITDDHLGEGGAKQKYARNIEAIRTLFKLEQEHRGATAEEQQVLSQYVGWGGLADAFDPNKDGWAKEYTELKGLLSEDEYAAARSSTLNAHYTSPTVIRGIYDAVERMGFRSGNILEPSMGVGNFFGMLPDTMQDSRLYGVELDSITGRIAKKLYPQADITVAGFETTDRRDFYDLAVGNVPFGQYKVNDKAYNKLGFSIHNYFFAKAIDQVRPGGVVAFVTSRYTMDSKDSTARKHMAERADLLGAIRLPNNAFKANAGTEVVSDIIFLQKRDRPADIEPAWVQLGKTEDGFAISQYFVDHPEMVLGELTTESTQYGREELTVSPIEGANLSDQLAEAVQHIEGNYTAVEIAAPDVADAEAQRKTLPADPTVKNFSYTVVDGEIYYRENSIMTQIELSDNAKGRVAGMVELRQIVNELIQQQLNDFPDEDIKASQAKLNAAYDAFTAKYGLINDKKNARLFDDDSSYYLLCSLENLDENKNLKSKADMFTKRTIRPERVVTSVDTPSEALAVSIGEHGKVDLPYMADLLGTPGEYGRITTELSGVIFKDPSADPTDPEAGWQTADEYLSGNVRDKLRMAQLAAESHPEFKVNVDALTKAQPKDLEASEIDVRLGATWLDPSIVQQFMMETFQPPYRIRYNNAITVRYSPYTSEWRISNKSATGFGDIMATETYGTRRANAYKILEDTLNLRDSRVYDTIEENGKEKRVLNQNETTLAQQKQQAIKDAFAGWVWKDPQRRALLVKKYNELFNSTRPREYDGSHIHFVGMNPEINLREHQRNAVAHVLYGYNTLLAHEVGAGKSFEMAASAMELKRLGLCQKSLFVVPNHLTEQWASEFLRLYPNAKLLVTSKKDFEPGNRKKFCARIATGDYDAVIIGHSQFEKIPLSAERQERLIQEQMDEIEEAIEEAKAQVGEHFTVKQLEKLRKSLKQKLEKLQGADRKDDVVTFEQLGVDRLFVDESQAFKNLYLYTKMRNVAGLSTSEAQKSSDMFGKCRYLDEITGGRGVIFATGTPLSNSMTEMYTLMRYLQYNTLQQKGLTHFDAWASTFGETTTAIELAPEGTGYRARTRFAKFFNLPELMAMFKEAADIKTSDQLHLPVPDAKFETVVVKPSEIQQDMVQALSERAAEVHSGSVDPSVDNMLKITSDGRKIGLDQRLMNSALPDDPNSKLNACVNNVLRIWNDTKEQKLTQLIFCDMSTPKGDGSFNVYDDIRSKLLNAGVPEQEIEFIHNADTENKKAELFSKVRSGQVRVLLGSTAKMGAGTNVQTRLVAVHHLDVGWRPSDMTQRNGRIIRQGNQNKQVYVYNYVTESTFDAYLYQTLENKQKFISQIMTSKSPMRSCDDIDEQALSYAEIKALCAGDPRIREKMDLDVQVAKLKVLRGDFQNQKYRLEDKLLKTFPEEIQKQKTRIAALQQDSQIAAAHPQDKENFCGMTIKGMVYDDKKTAGERLLLARQEMPNADMMLLGTYRGFELNIRFDSFKNEHQAVLRAELSYPVSLGDDARGNIIRLDNAIDNFADRIADAENALQNLEQQKQAAEVEVAKPFAQEEELAEKSARLAELNALLNIDRDRSSSQDAPEETEETETPAIRPSVLAALGEKTNQPEPVKPFRSYYDKDGDAR
ncbi:DEAD/DEAH box helicase family protein [Faecalibacterium sp. 7]|uniref:DEAD/DEAH box helicase family protein n=1 Tax=Faecalibacterium sp. 7 TaxID=3402017 RepID=UPI003C2B6679